MDGARPGGLIGQANAGIPPLVWCEQGEAMDIDGGAGAAANLGKLEARAGRDPPTVWSVFASGTTPSMLLHCGPLGISAH